MNFAMDQQAISRHPAFKGPSPDVGKATQFKPGVTGNPAGWSNGRRLSEALETAITNRDFAAGAKIICKAIRKGRLPEWIFVRDTLQGKPAMALELSGPDGGPVTVEHRIDRILERKRERFNGDNEHAAGK